MAEKASACLKATVKLPDLPPQENARGGGGVMHWNEPPLPIPPVGFISGSDRATAPDS